MKKIILVQIVFSLLTFSCQARISDTMDESLCDLTQSLRVPQPLNYFPRQEYSGFLAPFYQWKDRIGKRLVGWLLGNAMPHGHHLLNGDADIIGRRLQQIMTTAQ